MRRPKGEGSIYRRASDGLWIGSFIVRDPRTGEPLRTPSGKPKRLYVSGTKKSEVAARLKIKTGRYASTLPHRITVEDWLTAWIAESVEGHRRPATVVKYRTMVARHLGTLRTVRLGSVTPVHIVAWHRALREAGRTELTIRYAHEMVRTAFKAAKKGGKIDRDPFDAVRPPAADKQTAEAVPLEDLWTFLRAARGDRLEALYWVAAFGGLRLGEILALRWGDVDLRTGTVRVTHQLEEVSLGHGRRGARLAPLKTKQSRRTIRLPQSVMHRLEAMLDSDSMSEARDTENAMSQTADPENSMSETRDTVFSMSRARDPENSMSVTRDAELPPTHKADGGNAVSRRSSVGARNFSDRAQFVFRSDDGTVLYASRFYRKHFYPLLERAGVRFNFHRLRHTAATLAKSSGSDLFEIAAFLGHASTAITESVYVDFDAGMAAKVADRLDELIAASER